MFIYGKTGDSMFFLLCHFKRTKSPQFVVHLPSFYGMKTACSRRKNAKYSLFHQLESIGFLTLKYYARQTAIVQHAYIPLIAIANRFEINDHAEDLIFNL